MSWTGVCCGWCLCVCMQLLLFGSLNHAMFMGWCAYFPLLVDRYIPMAIV